jgi:two-component system, chemotaxis family, chemotaxis protein CheY
MPLKVLAVDDEPQVLELIKTMMSTAGCEVLTCADSRRAAETIAGDKFDAILLDARMPYLDGFGLTRAIRSSSLNRSTPIVMLTAFDDAQTLREGFRAGITFFLGKPFSHERFVRLFKVLSSAGWQEKRRSTRLPLRTPVRWRSGEKRSTSSSVDLSHDGMLLENTAGLQVGDEVGLEFNLPGVSSVLEMHARVTRKESSGNIVVQFLSLRPIEQEAISRYLSGSSYK